MRSEHPSQEMPLLSVPSPPVPDDFDRAVLPAEPSPSPTILDQWIAQGGYRAEKLTISRLSQVLNLPEYRLRRQINENLGYRNFNHFINDLRITEAAKRLQEEPETPVLNISLDVGYRSLTSFNRAFKDQFGVAPTEYRLGCNRA
jgi:AraC-like DNA-binding protein